jgi:uncharacterized membrane-anchored protein YitT (DUF2179 family)
VAFLLHYVTGISFGKLFFVVNLPFYWFAWTRMGREFTIKTFVCVALLSLLTELFPHVMHVDYLNPLFASLLGGLLLGTGCLFLARHRSSQRTRMPGVAPGQGSARRCPGSPSRRHGWRPAPCLR